MEYSSYIKHPSAPNETKVGQAVPVFIGGTRECECRNVMIGKAYAYDRGLKENDSSDHSVCSPGSPPIKSRTLLRLLTYHLSQPRSIVPNVRLPTTWRNLRHIS